MPENVRTPLRPPMKWGSRTRISLSKLGGLELLVKNEKSEVVAIFKCCLGDPNSLVVDVGASRQLLEVLRLVPRELLAIDVCYPKISDEFRPFSTPETTMSLNLDLFIPAEKPKVVVEKRTIFVAPSTGELPDDGFLAYQTVETIQDFLTAPDRCVVMLKEEQYKWVRIPMDYSVNTNMELRVLTGIANATYSVAFDEATWDIEKVAYAPFISELSNASDIANQLAAENRTEHEKQLMRNQRADGTVKSHAKFLGPEDDEEASEGPSDDEMSI